jgi:putative alpha-1,2-mannosidase
MQTEENTTSLTIRTSRQSPDARYIGRILLNGTPINRAWVYHHELAGSLLEFELVEQPQSGSLSEPPPCC